MEQESTHQLRYMLGAIIGLPLIVAIAISLYLSGSPNLSVTPVAPTPTALPAANVVAEPTERTVEQDEPVPTAATEAPPGPTVTRQPALPQNEAVVAVVRALLEGETGVYGIIISQPGENPEFSQNADVPFLAASLYKLVLLADVYDGIQNGLISPDAELLLLPEYFPPEGDPPDSYFDPLTSPDTIAVSEALFAAGAYSSNVAARVLLALTDEISLEATARDLGMDHTYFYVDPRDLVEWPPVAGPDDDPAALAEAVTFIESQADTGPLMITTPRDIATYFDKLIGEEVISADVSGEILAILSEQAVDDRFPCLLPVDTKMAHKTGNLDHVVHDVGIIWSPEGPMILIAMVEDPADDEEATLVIQQLADLAYTVTSDPYAVLESPPESNCPIVDEPGPESSPGEDSAPDSTVTEEPTVEQ